MSNSHSGTIGRTRGLSINGQVRRQRSIEWQKERRYSSSDDDGVSLSATNGQLSSRTNFQQGSNNDSSILAQLIAQTQQLTNQDRSYRSDCDNEDAISSTGIITENGALSNPSITNNRSPMHYRQASPFPSEQTNTRRLQYTTKAEERIRNVKGNKDSVKT
uniref:CSON000890 protein n=1 Tax=Culicoides sonorensis TaxID=179676 RepID=A0A336MG17_CULSO